MSERLVQDMRHAAHGAEIQPDNAGHALIAYARVADASLARIRLSGRAPVLAVLIAMAACACELVHRPRLVVLTGGPGAGKTAVLEVAQRELCRHVVVLPEAASILWRGQFPRRDSLPARKATQRSIAKLQIELERMTIEEGHAALILCDRGTLDGLAYWPGEPDEYLAELGSSRARELGRYDAVIHMRTPPAHNGYTRSPYRTETAEEAVRIDEQILSAWSGHPHRFVIDSQVDFLAKLRGALAAIRLEVPSCCATAGTSHATVMEHVAPIADPAR
jgi:predicted ATPase